MPYLSKEEQEFVSASYNPENDEIVFDAIYKDIEKSQYHYIWHLSQDTENYHRYTTNHTHTHTRHTM